MIDDPRFEQILKDYQALTARLVEKIAEYDALIAVLRKPRRVGDDYFGEGPTLDGREETIADPVLGLRTRKSFTLSGITLSDGDTIDIFDRRGTRWQMTVIFGVNAINPASGSWKGRSRSMTP